jgi:hypothetical protein
MVTRARRPRSPAAAAGTLFYFIFDRVCREIGTPGARVPADLIAVMAWGCGLWRSHHEDGIPESKSDAAYPGHRQLDRAVRFGQRRTSASREIASRQRACAPTRNCPEGLCGPRLDRRADPSLDRRRYRAAGLTLSLAAGAELKGSIPGFRLDQLGPERVVIAISGGVPWIGQSVGCFSLRE